MSTSSLPRHRLAFALDYPDLASARRGVELTHESAGVLKVGLELFIKEGPSAVQLASDVDCGVFLDLKLHDIPATVERAVATASQLGVRYLTVHAGGGPAMIEAAVRRAESEGSGLRILAVTVLTSLDADDLGALGITEQPTAHVMRLARLAHRAGARGFVSSMREVSALRQELGPEVTLVTPGIRPARGTEADQKRVGTPAQAIAAGSSLLVVGRPIRDAADPRAAARSVLEEIDQASSGTS